VTDSAGALGALKAAHERAWLAVEGVVAVGIGAHPDGTPTIVVSVERDTSRLRDELERRVPGVPVEIRVIGQPRAH
jgi:hypothetical protein